MTEQEWAITGVSIVTDPKQCPSGYIIIDRTYDRREDADLWRDGLFGRRLTRYMCVERSSSCAGKNILVDITLINEKEDVPAGFTCVEVTEDTREKATKKKTICVRWMSPSITNSAITELIILSRNVRRPPSGYSLVGEVNNMALCYKMSNIRSTPQATSPSTYVPPQISGFSGSSQPAQTFDMSQVGSNLPYSVHPKQDTLTRQDTLMRSGPQSASSLAMMGVNPLSGLTWHLNPKYQNINALQNTTIPEIRYKTIMDIEKQYEYKFNLERNAIAGSLLEHS
ncbi:hypothetical protein ScPMuIL_011122 [Solemya velum]